MADGVRRIAAGSRFPDRVLLVSTLLVLGLTIVYPVSRMVVQAVAHWQFEALTRGAGVAAVRNTLVISMLSVLTSGLVGTCMAFAFARISFPGRAIFAGLAYLPFTLPPLVGVVSFYYIIGRDGFVPRMLEQVSGVQGIHFDGPGAILLIHTYSFCVFFYAMVSAALESLDSAQLEAARTLGASRARVFFRVTVPQIMPALSGAALLTFMSSGASFSAPLIFGNNYPMLSVSVYEAQNRHDLADSMTLTVTLAAVSLLGVLLFRSRQKTRGGASKGVRVALRSAPARRFATVAGLLAVFLLLLPHLTIIWLSFVDHRAWHTEIVPTAMTIENYSTIFRDATAFRPIRNSLWMSAFAAAATLAVAVPAAYLIARKRPGGRLLNAVVMIPWALPGTVIAVNLIVAFNDRWLPLVGTVWMIPMAYFVRNIPLLTRMAAAAIEPFDATLIEAGRTLGGTPAFCFKRVVLPLLAPAIVAGGALVFATCLGEFVSSILLFSPANIPIAVRINEVLRGSGIGVAFAYSVFLMLLVGMTFVLARRFASRVI
ncbi:MAG: iron ABC transporter permease [Candidatus Hydrogenedentes bacterium]|nr:iron ABC transporter permease [Candidatus Hydrogenedentota bacterium]